MLTHFLHHNYASTHSQASSITSSQDDNLMTNIIGLLLLGGVIISASFITVGVFLLLFHTGNLSWNDPYMFPHTLSTIWHGVVALQPQAFIVLGLLLLIATPVLRVAVSIIAFALEHDRRYVLITCVVLAILVMGYLMGKGGA